MRRHSIAGANVSASYACWAGTVPTPQLRCPRGRTGIGLGQGVGVHGAHLEAGHALLDGVHQAAGGGHQGHGAVLQQDRGGRSGLGAWRGRQWAAHSLSEQARPCQLHPAGEMTGLQLHGLPAWRAAGSGRRARSGRAPA